MLHFHHHQQENKWIQGEEVELYEYRQSHEHFTILQDLPLTVTSDMSKGKASLFRALPQTIRCTFSCLSVERLAVSVEVKLALSIFCWFCVALNITTVTLSLINVRGNLCAGSKTYLKVADAMSPKAHINVVSKLVATQVNCIVSGQTSPTRLVKFDVNVIRGWTWSTAVWKQNNWEIWRVVVYQETKEHKTKQRLHIFLRTDHMSTLKLISLIKVSMLTCQSRAGNRDTQRGRIGSVRM